MSNIPISMSPEERHEITIQMLRNIDTRLVRIEEHMQATTAPERTYRVTEASQMLRVSPGQVRRWCKNGLMEYVRNGERCMYKFTLAMINKRAEEMKVKGVQ